MESVSFEFPLNRRAISSLRSDNPTSVLMSMKAVVNVVTAITDDVRAYERHPTRRDVSEDTIRHLRERADATLGNLVSAARNHAASFGLSPVSLMDAAASHVSSAIIELVKLLSLRRGVNERDVRSPTSPTPLNGGYNMPSLRSVESIKAGAAHRHGRTSSAASNKYREEDTGTVRTVHTFSRQSDRSTSRSPPPSQVFDSPGIMVGSGISDDSTTIDGSDDAWEELKVFMNHQLILGTKKTQRPSA
jgi:protein SPA2